MEDKKRITASELKVGIFVLVAAALLALAIFTIGSQVGLLEETFIAKTYLNNVSGLKPGDIVMLGGVEVGNVTEVALGSEELPDTQVNARQQQLIRKLEAQEAPLLRSWLARQEQLEQTETRFREALEQEGPDGPLVVRLRQEIRERENLVEAELKNLDRVRGQLSRARAGLQNIIVYLRIRKEFIDWIRTDSSISLGSVGLLGDKYIDISLGRLPDRPIPEEETVDGWFGTTTRSVLPITGRTQSGFSELITGANDVLANMENLSGTLSEIMSSFEAGEGTLGKLFSDESFFENINDTVLAAKDTVKRIGGTFEDITQGDGTISLLMQQRELYDSLNASMKRLEQIMTRVETGEGTFGKLVNDPGVYDNANQVMANIRDITGRMDAGEGTLGKLSTDEQLYVDLREALDQMTNFIQEIEEGKGTLGRLAKDEQLYENLNEVTSEVVKLLYDFRQNPKKFLTIKLEIF